MFLELTLGIQAAELNSPLATKQGVKPKMAFDYSAQVAELVDAHGSGPCAARCGGSSPLLGTTDSFRH